MSLWMECPTKSTKLSATYCELRAKVEKITKIFLNFFVYFFMKNLYGGCRGCLEKTKLGCLVRRRVDL